MAEPGHTAYEAYRKHLRVPPVPPWVVLTEEQRRRWALVERDVLALEELPAGEHEQAAVRYLSQFDSSEHMSPETGRGRACCPRPV